jgi:hypothetical protein
MPIGGGKGENFAEMFHVNLIIAPDEQASPGMRVARLNRQKLRYTGSH